MKERICLQLGCFLPGVGSTITVGCGVGIVTTVGSQAITKHFLTHDQRNGNKFFSYLQTALEWAQPLVKM